jgi:cytochrome bd-type quinol oxidase subunit 2
MANPNKPYKTAKTSLIEALLAIGVLVLLLLFSEQFVWNFGLWAIALALALVSIVTAIKALIQIPKNKENIKGIIFAIAAILLSVLTASVSIVPLSLLLLIFNT